MAIPDFDKVELLLPMTGANNGTVFTDFSLRNRTVTRAGNVLPVTSTDQSKFSVYGSSGRFPSNASGQPAHLRVTMSEAPGSGAFVVSGWMRPQQNSSGYTFIEGRCKSDFSDIVTNEPGFRVIRTSGNEAYFEIINGTGGVVTVQGGTIAHVSWTHILANRNADNSMRLFVDGVLVASSTCNYNLTKSAIAVGGFPTTFSREEQFLQDVMVRIGVDGPSANFTPPPRMTARSITRTNSGTDSHTVERAVLFDWGAHGILREAIPDINGNFVAADLVDLEYGVALITDGCDPVTRGPIAVDPD